MRTVVFGDIVAKPEAIMTEFLPLNMPLRSTEYYYCEAVLINSRCALSVAHGEAQPSHSSCLLAQVLPAYHLH